MASSVPNLFDLSSLAGFHENQADLFRQIASLYSKWGFNVVQAQGGRDGYVNVICKSVKEAKKKSTSGAEEVSPHENQSQLQNSTLNNAEEQLTQVSVPYKVHGQWTMVPIPISTDEIVVKYAAMDKATLQSVLMKNDQYISRTKGELLSSCVFGSFHGRLPRCSCNGHLRFDGARRGFVCAGIIDDTGATVMCRTFHVDVKCSEWRPPIDLKARCRFLLKIRHKKGQGYHIEFEGTQAKHNDCSCKPKSTTYIVENVIKESVALPENGRLSEAALNSIMVGQDLSFVSRTTRKRTVQKMVQRETTTPRMLSHQKIESFAKEICTLNPGSTVGLLTKNCEGRLRSRYFYTKPMGEALGAQSYPTASLSATTAEPMLEEAVEDFGTTETLKIWEKGLVETSMLLLESDEGMSTLKLQSELKQVTKEFWEFQSQYPKQRELERNALLETLADELFGFSVEQKREQISRFDAETKLKMETEDLKFHDEVKRKHANLELADFVPCREEEVEITDHIDMSPVDIEGEGTLEAICIVSYPSIRIARKIGTNVYGIDGAHVKDGKTEQKGQILVLESKDSMKRLVPIATTFCYSESCANLKLMMNCVARSGLELNESKNTIVSDRSKAAFALLKSRLPFSRHRFCEQHLIRNIKSALKVDFTSEQMNLIRACFRALTYNEFEQHFDISLKEELPRVHTYLQKLNRECWASYTFLDTSNRTFGIVDNNLCESRNNSIMTARKQKSILETLYELCRKMGESIVQRQEVLRREVYQNTFLVPSIMDLFNVHRREAGSYTVEVQDLNRRIFSVTHKTAKSKFRGARKVVNFTHSTCDCRKWQDLGCPCVHAVAVAVHREFNIKELYNDAFLAMHRVEECRQATTRSFVVPSLEYLQAGDYTILPPGGLQESQPRLGRPSEEKRFRSNGE